MLFFDSSIQSDFFWFFIVFGGHVDPLNRVKMSSRCIPRWLRLNSWKCTKTLIRITLLALSLLQHKLQNRWKSRSNLNQKPIKNRTKNGTEFKVGLGTCTYSILDRSWTNFGPLLAPKWARSCCRKCSRWFPTPKWTPKAVLTSLGNVQGAFWVHFKSNF